MVSTAAIYALAVVAHVVLAVRYGRATPTRKGADFDGDRLDGR